MREEDIHGTNRFAIFVHLHVERLDFFRIVGQNDGTLEVFFHEVAFVFAGEVCTPMHGEFKLMSVCHGFFEDLDAFCVGESHEVMFHHEVKTFQQGLVNHLVEELKVVGTVLQRPFHTIFDEVLCEVHVVMNVVECDFRFNHPEFCEVTRCVGVLGTEGWSKGVDSTEGSGTEFSFQLTAHGQGRRFAEEVVGIVNLSFLIFFQRVEVLRGDLEHLSSPFAVRSCDDGCVEIEETVVVEIFVDGISQIVANAEDCSESVGAKTHVGMRSHVLKTLSFFLHGIVFGAGAQDFNLFSLHFHALSCARAFHHFADDAEAGTGGDLLEQFRVKDCGVCHNLHVFDGATVVQSDEADSFSAATSANPSFHTDGGTKVRAFQQVIYFCSFHC